MKGHEASMKKECLETALRIYAHVHSAAQSMALIDGYLRFRYF